MGDFRLCFRRGMERREFLHPCTTSMKLFLCLFLTVGAGGMKTWCVLSYLYEHCCFFPFSYIKNAAFCDGYWQKLEDFQTEKYSGKNDFRMSDWNAAREERGEPALVFPLIEFPTLYAFLQDCFSRVSNVWHNTCLGKVTHEGCFKKY